MLGFFEKLFVVLLIFSGSLTTKYMSLSNKQCKTRPIVIDLSSVEPRYYPFMITFR